MMALRPEGVGEGEQEAAHDATKPRSRDRGHDPRHQPRGHGAADRREQVDAAGRVGQAEQVDEGSGEGVVERIRLPGADTRPENSGLERTGVAQVDAGEQREAERGEGHGRHHRGERDSIGAHVSRRRTRAHRSPDVC
jgi:hypothetical protein